MSDFRNRSTKRERHISVPVGESLTQQSFAKEADINTLVERHLRGPGRFGAPIGNPGASRQPIFGDFNSSDYHSMCNRVLDVQNQFRTLPARVRARFNNDAYQLIRFVENPENYKESVKLGLVLDEDLQVKIDDEVAAAKAADAEAAAAAEAALPPSGGLPQGDK